VLIDRKVLVKAKKHDADGVHDVYTFDENDKLIMSG